MHTSYIVSTAVLVLVVLAFFALTRGRLRQFGRTQWVLRVLAALPLAVSSIGHFAWTAMFASIIPPAFSHAEFWVILTGIFELAGAIGLLLPKTARAAAVGVALLMIAIFPANVYAAGRSVGGLHMPGVPVRLAMQVVYILVVLLAGWGIPSRARI